MDVSQKEEANLFGVYVQVKERFRGKDCFEWRWLHDFATQQPAMACAETFRKWFAAVQSEDRPRSGMAGSRPFQSERNCCGQGEIKS
ncbi:MAG: hypothetical protein NC211_07725 [Alistipes senegalensis]|nr:hypothetical protein [Oxalobacter formigenes]MCM1281697.1 hypothetical protein [Alistipes senegalensis]